MQSLWGFSPTPYSIGDAPRGVTRGAQFPGRQITMGSPSHCEERQMAAVGSTFFSIVCLLPKDLNSNMGAPNLLLAPSAI